MGFGFLVLFISFVPLSRARDLRTPATVDRRSAPDPLLGEIFNDPTATSLSKLNLEDNDNDNENNVSGSGSELWLGSGRLPEPSRDSSQTIASHGQRGLQTAATQTASTSFTTNTSPNHDISSERDSKNIVDDTKISELANETPQNTNVINTPPVAQNVLQQSSTATPLASSVMTSQGVDSKLPSAEDQSQNKVVQSEESAKTTKDTSATNADIFPSKPQTLVENFAENPTAGFIGQQASPESPIDALGFDDNSLYDPTIVKKTDIPNGLNMVSNTVANNSMEIPGTARSTIPEEPIVPQASAVAKSAPASIPYKGSFPLQLHKYLPSTKLIKKNIIGGETADFDQQYIKKDSIPSRSVLPGLSESGGLRPLMVNLPQQLQQQQYSSNTQAPPSLQVQAPLSNQTLGSFGDQPQVMLPTVPATQPFAPVTTESQSLAPGPSQAVLQTPEQALDQAQTGIPQASARLAVPSDMQSPGVENTVAAFPMNATINGQMPPSTPETAGIPVQGAQVVSVYKGLTPKKPMIDEDQCEDQFETCPEMAKNEYCTKYPDLMKIQCKKSCKFCPLHTGNESSAGPSSGYDEYSESGSSVYYDSDQASGSGSSDWSDNSEEDDAPEYKKARIPRPIHKVLMSKFSGDAGSDSEESGDEESADSADDATRTSGSGEAASGSQKKDVIKAKMGASGSGEAVSASASSTASAAEIGSSSGSLAEDLATGTVSKANEKHSRIHQTPRPQQESVYPKIDLKEIAKAVNLYRGVALKMLGEALEGAAQEKEDEITKKSRIPLPPATKILQKMGFPVGVEFGAKRDMIPNGVASNYGMIGYGNNGYAYNNPSPAENEPLADFYNQYQQEPNFARSEIMVSPEEPEEDDQQNEDEGAAQAQDEQPQEIQPVPLPTERVNDHVEQQKNITKEVAKETKKQENLQSSQNKTSDTNVTRKTSFISYNSYTNDNWKKSEIADPFEYVRNMGEGASMEPIRSQTAARVTSMSHSDPIILWKNSQLSAMSALARKKSTIPQPASGPVMPALTQTMQETFQAAPQQFRSDIPSGSNSMIPLVQQNTTGNVPEAPGQAVPLAVPVFPQYTPQSEALTRNAGDSLVARSQIENLVPSTQQSQQQEEGLHAQLRPQQSNVSAADLKNAIPQAPMGSSFREVSTRAPIPGSFPLTLRKIVPGMAQKKDELYKQVQAGINRDSVPLSSVDFVANKKLDFSEMNNSVQRPAQIGSDATRSSFLPGGASSLSDNTEKAADLINEALMGTSPAADNSQSSDPLIGSLESKITTMPENPENPISVDSFSSPGVEISGKIPSGSSLDGLGTSAITRAQVSHATGGVSNIDKGVGKQKISDQNSAANLPPLHHDDKLALNPLPFNHGMELAGALPPLNHNVDVTSRLPPLNHAKEEAANLPPLLHGIEQAGNLPSLNHATDVLHSFNDLPPLNHGKEQAENLPPLNHGIENNRLPPLNHGSEAAGNLPPLLLGVEQASHMPSPSYEKQASQGVDVFSAFTSHTDNVAPLSDHGKHFQHKVPLHIAGLGKSSFSLPKASNIEAGNFHLQPQAASQPSILEDLTKSFHNIPSVVQGKEIIDSPHMGGNGTSADPLYREEIPLPAIDENTKSEALDASIGTDKGKQRLFTADGISQDSIGQTVGNLGQKRTPGSPSDNRGIDTTGSSYISANKKGSTGKDVLQQVTRNEMINQKKAFKLGKEGTARPLAAHQELQTQPEYKKLQEKNLSLLKNIENLEGAGQPAKGGYIQHGSDNSLLFNGEAGTGDLLSHEAKNLYGGRENPAFNDIKYSKGKELSFSKYLKGNGRTGGTSSHVPEKNLGLTSSPIKEPLSDTLGKFLPVWNKSPSHDSDFQVSQNWANNALNTPLRHPPDTATDARSRAFSNENNKPSLKQEIAAEKQEILESLGQLEDALNDPRGKVPKPRSDLTFRKKTQVPGPTPFAPQPAGDKSSNYFGGQYNPTSNKLIYTRKAKTQPMTNQPKVLGDSLTQGLESFPSARESNQVNANGLFRPQSVKPNPVANELTSDVNFQTQGLRFNQVVGSTPRLKVNPSANKPNNSAEFNDDNALTSQPLYNNDFNVPSASPPNQLYVNPNLNPGEMILSYIDKSPQPHPLLQHAYPASNALLPSVNHQHLPPLNHNDLIATAASRYTGSKDNVLSMQGETRSKSPPPLYPFTIPPEGEEESQGYHAERGRENYHEAAKASSQASARGLFPMAQAKKPIIPAMKPTNGEEASFQASSRGLFAAAQAKKPNNPAMKPSNGEEQAASRQLFPEGGQPYPLPLPPEGNQNDPINMDSTANNPVASRQMFPEGGQPYPIPLPPEGSQNDPLNVDSATNNRPFDSQLLEDPNPFSTPQLPAGWKKGNINPWSNYAIRLPPENGKSEPTTPSLNRKQIGKKNLIRPKPDLQCGTGWTGALGDFGSFCYKEVFEHKTWDTARHACRNLGGDLFSVTNAYEQRFLENFTNIESWLGYRDKSRDGTWSWSDSSLSVFTNWDSSTKNDHGKGRDCVLLNSKEGKWNDASCSNNHAYLCKKKAEDCSEGWKKLTLNTVRGCYKLFNEPKSWEKALGSCMDEGASLSSILSDDEQTMISQVYSKYDFWIGYNDIDNEGDWVWSDRMTSSYTNWDDKSPNNGGVSCAIVTRGGKWHDEPCQSQFSFICKKPSPKGPHHPLSDATLTQEVQKLVSNKSLLNPDIDTTVTIFGRHPVTPQYFWTVQKIFNNRIHGSNTISGHGDIKSVDGGVQLNGMNAWLDAGDFYGQCLGDPDLCIKGFSFALQLNFDDDALSYKDKRYILDSSGSSRGVSIFIQNGSLYYKVVASTKEWELSTELVTNEWQDIVITWKKEEGLMLYVNGAFRDSLKDGTLTNPVPNKQARLTIGRKSGNPPFKYTRMYISSLCAFTRFLAPEDVPYVFTLDDTVVPRYMWLLPHLTENALPGSPDIEVHGMVRAVDGGVHMNGKESFLKVGNFEGKCLHDPAKCPDGLSVSCKLKFNKVVRTYKEPRYILDSGGHQKGIRGLSAYLLNNNLYFSVVMSTDEDTLAWTVRTSIFTVRWQRVVLSWSLTKGLWLYTDSQFRGWTKTPKSVPRDVVTESSEFIIGRRNVDSDDSAAEFSIGSLAVFPRFLEKKDVEKVFGGKKMPYPGLIREVWKELPGKSISKLKDDPYYPNDPSLIEIIENFDSPFDIDKDYGSRVKGYFVAPETGNYTFYMSGSQSGELWLSGTESQQNLSKLVSLGQPTGHNQWNKYAGQISKSIILEAGKYYYITGLQKGTESTDSLSAGVRLPSGRFMRPITKEILQWRMPGDPFAGVIREVWQDIPGYRLMDLTSNPNFPNNPSSIEVLDKFDAPHNVDDNYGSRIRGFFKAPESGQYRFFLAADTTGELWLSSDETEKNLKKVVTINGWTAHNEWLKFPEQKSERIHLKKGKYYYLEAYQKAEKLADCVSVAVELPSGHFEGPIKRVHLSWRLPDGKTGPGPSSEEEAIPKPVGLYPFNKAFGAKDAGPNNENGVLSNVDLTTGPDEKEGGAYDFKGTADSFVEIPNDGKLDTQYSMTLLANIFPTGTGGPILNYKTNGWGVHLWQFEANELFVRFVHRNGIFHKPLASRVLQLNEWNQVGATYDNTTGVAQLWHNGKMVKSRNIGQIKLATQYAIRIGAKDGDERRYSGKISCLQIYNKALDEQQIGNLRSCPVQAKKSAYDEAESGDGSGSGAWEEQDTDSSAVSFSHNAGKYDKDEEADDEIQGSESTSGNKCDPQPCENGGKCVRDSKRLDGYRCKCTSDFTGRNCQVSKPDAENPIVKKAKIPKPEIKTGSEYYQRNTSSLNIIENIPEEKKQDILLLFQKVGCFKDESVQHDLPSQVTVKSVTQEECVRSCALQEKGYSYFGLQSADRCFCGHRYGKYGKADDSLCNMPCQGNNKENCGGNSTNMVYFFGLGYVQVKALSTNYTVSIFTGDVEGAATDAKVYITLYGEKGDSGFRKINTNHFGKATKATNTLILPDLGKLLQVRILHDNTGAAPSWFLEKVMVTDENGLEYEFPCKEWLSETQSGGKTERLLRLKSS